MRWREITEVLDEASALVTMYHGTALENVPNILKHGLRPSDKSNASDDRWATLGGVYLTSSFDYAVKAARTTYPDQPLAVIVVRTSIAKATPDEDVVEKALIKAFTSALDAWGIDDAYEADLEMYARAEEERPLDDDEKPFDRAAFFRDFWTTVMENMSQIAGTPRRRDPETVQAAVNMAIELADEDVGQYVNLQHWQAVKERLVALYPRLRSIEQHTNAGLTIAHNVRMTKPIRRSQIVDVMTKQNGKWTSMKMVEAATQGELSRLADLARQCDSVEQFIRKTDGMDVLYRGHYDDQTGNNVFMTDYVGHAGEYIDDSGRIDAYAFDPYNDVFLYNDAHFAEMRDAYRQLSGKQFSDLYRAALMGNRFANQLMDRRVIAKVRRVIQADTPYSEFSGNHDLNDLLVPLLQKYARDAHGKNIIAFMGNDYADYGGQMEFVVGDVSKLVDLRQFYAKVKAES